MGKDAVSTAVLGAVAEAVGLEPEMVAGSASLLGDLDAESIDLLDILFRIERELGVRISASELADYVQGGIPDEEFGDADNIITTVGLTQLTKVMPQVNPGALFGKLHADEVLGLFTVDNLVLMVRQRLAADGLAGSARRGAAQG